MTNDKPAARKTWRIFWLVLYYGAILAGVIQIHWRSGLATPSFIYQGF